MFDVLLRVSPFHACWICRTGRCLSAPAYEQLDTMRRPEFLAICLVLLLPVRSIQWLRVETVSFILSMSLHEVTHKPGHWLIHMVWIIAKTTMFLGYAPVPNTGLRWS